MRKLKLTELNRVGLDEYNIQDKLQLIVILDNIRSAMNVGSIFRTSDAMAITAIHLCGITATPPNKEITKTAIGATESVEWKYFEQTKDSIKLLKNLDYHIIGVEQTDSSIELMDYQFLHNKIAIVLGNEVQGVSENVLPFLDEAVEIAQYGTKHSLNVSVCGGIVIHHFSNHLRQS